MRRSEVTTVVEDHQPLIGDALLSDGKPGLMLVVRSSLSSTSDVTKGVQDALASMDLVCRT